MKNGPYELVVAPNGYPGMRYRGRYAYEHHVVWWKEHGQVPPKDWEIHHLNGDHRDNRIENLSLVTWQAHAKIHADLRRKPLVKFQCGFCSKDVSRKPNHYHWNLRHSKSGKLFCSKSCGAKNQFQTAGQVNRAHC